jgi:hypothetical protein
LAVVAFRLSNGRLPLAGDSVLRLTAASRSISETTAVSAAGVALPRKSPRLAGAVAAPAAADIALPAVAAEPLYTHEQLGGLDDILNWTDEDDQKFRVAMVNAIAKIKLCRVIREHYIR